MKQRTITAIFFVVAMLAGIFGGLIPFLGLFAVVAAGSGWELLKLLTAKDDRAPFRRVVGAVLGLYPFALAAAHQFGHVFDGQSIWWPVVALAMPAYILLLLELVLASERPFTHIGHYLLALFYVGLPLALLIDIAQVDGQYLPLRVLGLIGLNWLNDTFAYLTGSMIGRTPFFPRISPKKTWEGTLGGIVFTVLAAALLGGYMPVYTPTQWIALAACVAIFGTVGDLIESMLKRSVGVKDSGSFMPGHGGFLDRFDSFIFLLPFVWVVLKML